MFILKILLCCPRALRDNWKKCEIQQFKFRVHYGLLIFEYNFENIIIKHIVLKSAVLVAAFHFSLFKFHMAVLL